MSHYVDNNGNMCVVYSDHVVHYINDELEDSFGKIRQLSPVHFIFETEKEKIQGEWNGKCINWNNTTCWHPVKMSTLQFKYMTQKPYIPMTFVIAYFIYITYEAIVFGIKQLNKQIRSIIKNSF
jgi:hypothetical protein